MSEQQESQALIPVEQQTIMFHGKPLVVVRLPDGRPGVVLRWLCENLHLDSSSQVRRIQRTEVIADDLVYTRVQTDGGLQIMPTLVLHAAPYWLATIDTRRMEKEDERRLEILRYQREVVDVLYAWASTPQAIAAPTDLIPVEPIIEPTRPTPDASLNEWIEYHQRMAAVLEWQRDAEQWHSGVESRLESLETIIPDILDRLPPQTLTTAHQQMVRTYVHQLNQLTQKHHATIYEDLKIAFEVARYSDIPEEEWTKVERWFKGQIDQAKKK